MTDKDYYAILEVSRDATDQEIKKLRGEDSNEYKIASDAMGMVWKGLLQATKGIDLMAVR